MTGRIRREPRWKRFTRLAHERLESRVLLVGDLLISELMPDNNSTLADEDGHYEDWIEIHNQGETPIQLQGWALTDDAADLQK